MKRILGFIGLLVFVFGCDDGDLSITTFNLPSQNLNKCSDNTFIYNVNGNEVLLLDIPLSEFKNQINKDNEGNIISDTYTYVLTENDKLIYRLYNGNVNSSFLCSDFPSSELVVVEEWKALAGAIIEITTIANADSENGGILGVSGYTHHIVIKDVIFTKGNGKIVYEEYIFGNYITSNLVKFNFSDVVQKCPNNLLYKLDLKESLVVQLDYEHLFPNEVTSTPRVTYINGTTNRIIYKVFDDNITGAYFCSTIPQTSPNVVEEWYAQNGEEDSGIIEVTTEAVYDEVTGNLAGYIHHITLINVLFYNSNSAFHFGGYYVGGYGVEL